MPRASRLLKLRNLALHIEALLIHFAASCRFFGLVGLLAGLVAILKIGALLSLNPSTPPLVTLIVIASLPWHGTCEISRLHLGPGICRWSAQNAGQASKMMGMMIDAFMMET